ncbi:unnamed protein product [Rotaria socialis]|uniref:Uncharacterized protein n=1 Tax=Rotaria socialis TaxID=392032 RepID=A0A821CSW2_9BILA|nr:unnamed protein product [Rotaria socialis]CAF3703689.1 unnamed protein product [Rotaria socialis]CAF4256700.1 unnamed protein product [Rotaria socialis]CAF4608487.1 unnamed protein product [Rotaria socialis]
MIKFFFIVSLLISLIKSNPIEQHGWTICDLSGYFIPLNGYRWFIVNKNTTICTCPDNLQSTINRPCRICHRENICGSKEAFCSEESTFFITTNTSFHYACFCQSDLFLVDKKCPENIVDETTSSINLIEETTNPNTMSTTVFIEETTKTFSMTSTNLIEETSIIPSTESSKTTTTTTTVVNSSMNSYQFLKIYFVILLNIVYFLNK